MKKRIARSVSNLVQFNTENPPVESYEVQLHIRDELKQSGLKTELHYPGDNAVALTCSFGSGKLGLTLYGHVDVVPAGDKMKWKYPPYSGRIEGDRIYGRGASDMKSGVAALLYAYKLLYESDIELPGRLEFVSVLDEENWHKTPVGWNTSDWLLRKRSLKSRACLMGEVSGISKICIGERGDFWIKLKSTGRPTHGSRSNYEENACVRLFRCLDEISRVVGTRVTPPREIKPVVKNAYKLNGAGLEKTEQLETYSMNVGVLSGGTMINMVPESCEANIAFCIPLGSTREVLEAKIRRILKKKEHSTITIECLQESQSDPTYTSPNSGLVTAVGNAVEEATGRWPFVYVTAGTSDANVFRKRGVETCFYGPGTTENIHSYNESVSIKDTVTATKVYLLAMVKYFNLGTK